MKFALIVDHCKVESYVVRDQKAYKMKSPETPYSFHHSIGNESFMGFWGYPFVFEGCFINWGEWEELPDLDLDVIFVVIEKDFINCQINDLRNKYPNAQIFSVIKEMDTYSWMGTFGHRIEVYKQCDKIFIPTINVKMYDGPDDISLMEYTERIVHYLPQPVDTHYLYDNFYQEEREEKIFSYFPIHTTSRCGDTEKFTQYISEKYGIPFVRQTTQFSSNQWEDFLKLWTPCTFHFNLDPIPFYPGQQAMQCAALGVIHIGGINDSHPMLWPETATNNKKILEDRFVEYTQDTDKRTRVLQYARKQLNNIYSYDAIRDRFKEIGVKK